MGFLPDGRGGPNSWSSDDLSAVCCWLNQASAKSGGLSRPWIEPGLFTLCWVPVLHADPGLEQVAEGSAVEELVAWTAIERLGPGILPCRAGVDQQSVGPLVRHQSATA